MYHIQRQAGTRNMIKLMSHLVRFFLFQRMSPCDGNHLNHFHHMNGCFLHIFSKNPVISFENVLTNYFYTLFYARAIRNVERDLRCSLVRRLQQLSISYHNEMQSGRLQSKIMRDVEQIETLSKQIFISMLSIVMNIAVSFAVVVTKSMTVFVFFLATTAPLCRNIHNISRHDRQDPGR